MKTLKTLFLMAVITASAGYSAYTVFTGPCDSPKGYRIGTLDERFGITETQFLLAIQEAERVWEDAVGKDLFVFASEARLPINLIYDERQATSDRNEVLESSIEKTEKTAETVKREFESLKRRHEASEKDYASMLSDFKARQDAYNAKIAHWNGRGGAPKKEYEELESAKAALETSYAALEEKRREVNGLAAEINAQIAKYNYLVREVNATVDVINESADKEFEQGEFIRDERGEKVDIFAFQGREDLVRVLAHELGHVLDADHNKNPDSIMYYLNTSKNVKPTAEDVEGIKTACKFEN